MTENAGRTTQMLIAAAECAKSGTPVVVVMANATDVKRAKAHLEGAEGDIRILSARDFELCDFEDTLPSAAEVFVDHYVLESVTCAKCDLEVPWDGPVETRDGKGYHRGCTP